MTPGVEVELPGVGRRPAREIPAPVGVVVTAGGELPGGYVFSRGGAGMLRDPADAVLRGDRLLLLSTIGGG